MSTMTNAPLARFYRIGAAVGRGCRRGFEDRKGGRCLCFSGGSVRPPSAMLLEKGA